VRRWRPASLAGAINGVRGRLSAALLERRGEQFGVVACSGDGMFWAGVGGSSSEHRAPAACGARACAGVRAERVAAL
jgi:hypothetical protein